MAAFRKQKTLVVALDAVSAEFFNPLFDGGKLPNFASYFSDGLRIKHNIGVFPTVSPCNHGAVTYGLGPGRSNLVGLSWYNKETGKYFNELTIGGILADLNKKVPARNIFESSRHSLAFGPQLTRGSRTILPIYATFAFNMANWATRLECSFIKNIYHAFKIYDNVYFGSLSSDHVGHAFGLDGIKKNLMDLDKAFGELFRKLDPETNVIIFSDHGSAPIDVHKPIHLNEFLHSAGMRSVKRLRRINDYVLCTTVVTYAHLYANASAAALSAILKNVPGITFCMYRDPDSNGVIVESAEGTAALLRDGAGYAYFPGTGDPLGYGHIPEALDRPLLLDEWADLTYLEKYPAAPPRIIDLFDSKNTGDVVLNIGGGYYPYYAGITQAYTHGSLLRDDILVPVLARGPDVEPGVLEWGTHEMLHAIISTCVGEMPQRP